MGLALLDTSIVIAALNRHDALHPAAPAGRADAVALVERFAAQTRILDVSPSIARLAAELRATRGLRLPDAVIVATGLRQEADCILTGDARWKGIETVRVLDG